MSRDKLRVELDYPEAGDVVEYLKATAQDTPALYDAVLACAVPHWFDARVVHGMVPEEIRAGIADDELLQQLRDLPFCVPHPITGWTFERSERDELLDHVRLIGRADELHRRAAALFAQLVNEMNLSWDERIRDELWRYVAAERIHHLLYVDPPAGLALVRKTCAAALAVLTPANEEVQFCSDLLNSLDPPREPERIEQTLAPIREGIQALLSYRSTEAVDLLADLAAEPDLPPDQEGPLRSWLGAIYVREIDNLAQALAQFERAEQLIPDSPQMHAEFSEVYLCPGPLAGRLDLARRHIERAIELNPRQQLSYTELGALEQQLEHWDKARRHYEQLVALAPDTIDGRIGLSEVAAALRETDRALAELDKLIELSPGSQYYALIRKGNICQAARRFADARKYYQQAAEQSSERADAFIGLGQLAAALRRSAEAEEHYRTAIAKGTEARDKIGMSNGYVWLADLYRQQERIEDARALYQEAINRNINTKLLYYSFSDFCSERLLIDEVRKLRQALARIDPAETYAMHCAIAEALVVAAIRTSDAAEHKRLLRRAGRALHKAVALDPHLPWAYCIQAQIAALEGNTRRENQQAEQLRAMAPWGEYELLTRLGRIYLDLEQTTTARSIVQRATELEPERLLAWIYLRDLYRSEGDLEGVIATWAKIVEIDPALKYQRHLDLGDLYRERKDRPRAEAEYVYARQLEPDTSDAYFRLAALERDAQRWQSAVANYRRGLSRAPDDAPAAYVAIAATLREQARAAHVLQIGDDADILQQCYSEAERAARAAIMLAPGMALAYQELARIGVAMDNEALIAEAREHLLIDQVAAHELEFAIGESYHETGDFQRAEEALRRYLQFEPPNAQANIMLVQALVGQQKLEQARSWVRNLLDTLDLEDRYNAELRIGEAYEQGEQFGDAEALYQAAGQLKPDQPEAYLKLASLLRRQGRTAEAQAVYGKIVTIADIPFLALGRYYEQTQQPDDAIEAYRLGVEHDPPEQAYEVTLSLGRLLAEQRRLEDAESMIQKVIDCAPDRSEGYTAMAELREQQSRWDEAIALYHKAAERASDGQIRGSTHVADLLIGQKRYAEAVELLLRLVADEPNNAEACFQLGTAYDYLDNTARALEWYTRTTELAFAQGYVACMQIYAKLNDAGNVTHMAEQLLALELPQEDRYKAYLLVAESYWQVKNLDAAEQALRAAIDLDPDDPDAYVELSRLYLDQQKWDEALAVIRPAATSAPDQTLVLYVRAAKVLMEFGHDEQAEHVLEEAIATDPGSSEAHYLLGTIYERTEKPDQALEEFVRVTALDPKHAPAYAGQARLYGRRRDTDRVERAARQLLSLNLEERDRYEARLILAQAYRDAGAVQKAEAELRAAMVLDPHSHNAYVQLMDLLADQRDWERATEVSHSMAQQPELFYGATLSLGNLFLMQQRLDEASAAYAAARDREPQTPDAYLHLAWLKLQQQDLEQAEAFFTQAHKLAGTSFEPLAGLAQIREAQGNWGEAIQLYREAIAADPSAPSRLYQDIGELLIQEKRYGEAIEALQKGIALGRSDARAYYALGIAAENASDIDKAVQAYSQAITVDPTYGNAYIALAWLYATQENMQGLDGLARRVGEVTLSPDAAYDVHRALADGYRRKNLFEWAIQELTKAVTLVAKPLDAYMDLGWIYEFQQRWEKARDAYTHVAELSPEMRAEVNLRLALISQQAGDLKEAAQYARRAMDMDLSHLGPDQAIEAYLAIADIYQQCDDNVAAASACDLAITLVNALPEPDSNMIRRQGLAYLKCGAYSQAIDVLRQSLVKNPNDVQARLYLAVALLGAGKPAEAQTELDIGIEHAQGRDVFHFPLEEARALARQLPDIQGAGNVVEQLIAARDRFPAG